MIRIDFEGGDDLRFRLERAADLLFGNFRDAFRLVGLAHERRLQKLHRAPPATAGAGELIPHKPPGSPLSTITRGLLGPLSTGTEVSGAALDDLAMLRYIGRGIPYARIHEEGGVIRPRLRKVLTVPTKYHRTRAGDFRGRAIHFEGYWRKTKKGSLIFFDRATGLPMFVGLLRVVIPPRLRFRATWADMQDLRSRAFANAVTDALDGKRYGARAQSAG